MGAIDIKGIELHTRGYEKRHDDFSCKLCLRIICAREDYISYAINEQLASRLRVHVDCVRALHHSVGVLDFLHMDEAVDMRPNKAQMTREQKKAFLDHAAKALTEKLEEVFDVGGGK